MSIKLTSSKQSKDHIKCVVYGASGSGKTRLGATAPNPIILDADEGLLSISDDDIPSIKVSSYKDIKQAIKFIKSKKGKDFDTVIVDDLTEIGEITLQHLKDENKDGRQSYMKLGEETLKVIRKFKKIKKHIVFICKLRRIEDDGEIINLPSMPGKVLLEALPYAVDEVFSLRVDEDEDGKPYSYICTRKTRKWEGKDRSKKLKKIEEPNLTKIFKKIKGVK